MKKQIVCPVCDGKGYVVWTNRTEDICSTGSKTCPHCDGTGIRMVDMTNGDRIRAMSDEVLAKFICRRCKECSIVTCPGAELCNGEDGEANGLIKWLQQPSEA